MTGDWLEFADVSIEVDQNTNTFDATLVRKADRHGVFAKMQASYSQDGPVLRTLVAVPAS